MTRHWKDLFVTAYQYKPLVTDNFTNRLTDKVLSKILFKLKNMRKKQPLGDFSLTFLISANNFKNPYFRSMFDNGRGQNISVRFDIVSQQCGEDVFVVGGENNPESNSIKIYLNSALLVKQFISGQKVLEAQLQEVLQNHFQAIRNHSLGTNTGEGNPKAAPSGPTLPNANVKQQTPEANTNPVPPQGNPIQSMQ